MIDPGIAWERHSGRTLAAGCLLLAIGTALAMYASRLFSVVPVGIVAYAACTSADLRLSCWLWPPMWMAIAVGSVCAAGSQSAIGRISLLALCAGIAVGARMFASLVAVLILSRVHAVLPSIDLALRGFHPMWVFIGIGSPGTWLHYAVAVAVWGLGLTYLVGVWLGLRVVGVPSCRRVAVLVVVVAAAQQIIALFMHPFAVLFGNSGILVCIAFLQLLHGSEDQQAAMVDR